MGSALRSYGNINIDGLKIIERKQIIDERGAVMHHIKSTDEEFSGFGESYISTINPGIIKAWKRHTQMTQLFVVPHGEVQFIFFDGRASSPTYKNKLEIIIGFRNYYLIKVPPMIWYGFECVSKEPSIIVNCASRVHDPNEVERLESNSFSIPENW